MSDLPRLLILDLDGTAVTHDDVLLDEDVAAAERLSDAGVHITIATGRLYPGTDWVAKRLGVVGHVAVMNGCEHVDVATDEVGFRQGLPLELRGMLRDGLAERGLESFLFASEGVHYDQRSARHVDYLHIWTRAVFEHVDLSVAPLWESGDALLCICALGSDAAMTEAQSWLAEVLPDGMRVYRYVTYMGEHFIEIRHAAENKGTALHRLAAERGLSAADTVAVGDWNNDIPMLKAAGHSYVMAGSDPQISALADGILDARRGKGGAVASVARAVWGI